MGERHDGIVEAAGSFPAWSTNSGEGVGTQPPFARLALGVQFSPSPPDFWVVAEMVQQRAVNAMIAGSSPAYPASMLLMSRKTGEQCHGKKVQRK
jgi:hypothetical protein